MTIKKNIAIIFGGDSSEIVVSKDGREVEVLLFNQPLANFEIICLIPIFCSILAFSNNMNHYFQNFQNNG